MKKLISYLFISFALYACNVPMVHAQSKSLILVDTLENDSYAYQPLIDAATSVGFKVSYAPLSAILDKTASNNDVAHNDAIFFLLSGPFLKTLNTSPVSQKILSLIDSVSKHKDKLIGLIFPSLSTKISACMPIFQNLGFSIENKSKLYLPKAPETRTSLNSFSELLNRFLALPLEARTIPYHTTLLPPKNGLHFGARQQFSRTHAQLAMLPHNTHYETSLSPLGLYWYNPHFNNHLFIGLRSTFASLGISENFRLSPAKNGEKQPHLQSLHEMVWELKRAMDSARSLGIPVTREQKPPLPKSLSALIENKKQQHDPPIKSGWIEIEIFEQEDKQQQQKLLVDTMLTSGLDYAWLSISPNWYYSPIAKRTTLKDKMLQSVARFTKLLKQRSEELKKRPPKLLIGFEIANNLYAPTLPKKHARNIYGQVYDDLPAPLDKEFWNNEIILPLKTFARYYSDPSISNGIPLSGVVIDLEMYGRKSAGAFLPTMGCEESTLQRFFRKPISLQELSTTNKVGPYFSFLKNEAVKIGALLRSTFDKIIPKGFVGCYAPNISTAWFYKGLYKGMSRSQIHPLHLFTFNSEFNAHRPWLKNNHINARHLSVLMLSKLKSPSDFGWVDHIFKNHDGIWLNRFSRFAEKYTPNAWTTIEQSSMSQEQIKEFCSYLAKKQ